MGGTANNKIHCPAPDCQKPILSQVALAEGTRFILKCPGCGGFVKIFAGFNYIEKRLLREPRELRIITEEK